MHFQEGETPTFNFPFQFQNQGLPVKMGDRSQEWWHMENQSQQVLRKLRQGDGGVKAGLSYIR